MSELGTYGLLGTSRADWRKRAPLAKWRDFRGHRDHPPESSLPRHRELWCSEATDLTGGVSRELVFYGLRTERPYDCRAEQIRYVIPGGDEVYDALTRELRDAFGSEHSLSSALRRYYAVDESTTASTGYASATWRDLTVWAPSSKDILLYRTNDSIQLLMQSHILAGAAREQPATGGDRYGLDPVRWELGNALRPRDPEAAELVFGDDRGQDQEFVETVTLRVLKAQSRAPSISERELWALAAVHLAARIRVEGQQPERVRPGLRPLVALGLKLEESRYDEGIWYASWAPNQRDRRAFAGTRWGRRGVWRQRAAAAKRYEESFDYRGVIIDGLAWLQEKPPPDVAIAVMLNVGQAYETWWSLSLAPADEELVTAADHLAGSVRARLEAIRWYERIIREAPASREADYARRVIVQLRVGVDTGARFFFNPYA